MAQHIQSTSREWQWYACAMLALMVALSITIWVYYASLTYPFEFDDLSNIVKLFKVRFATFRSLFFANSRWISYWLNAFYYSLLPEGHKFDPYLYRVGNLIIHLIAGAALFVTTTLLQQSKCLPESIKRAGALFPFLTVALFLLHPVQTQTVSYVIQGQLEGGAGAFIFIMTSLFLLATSTTLSLLRWTSLTSLFVIAALSCGSKEIIIVAPVLMMLIDWFFVACGSWQSFKTRWWIHILLFCIIVSLYLYLLKPHYFLTILGGKMELQSNVGNMLTETRLEKITAGSFFISQFKVIVHYLSIFFWPFSMSVDYDWKLAKHFCAPDSLFPFLLLVAVGSYILLRLRRNSTDLLSFCLLWFFIGILPRSSIIPSTELLADYKTYIASFGIYFLQAWLITALLVWLRKQNWWRGGWISCTGLALGFVFLVAYAAQCRNRVWRSPEAFWADVIKHAPQRARAYNNYGVALCELGRHQEAIANFKRAISLDGYYADPYNNLSVAYAALKKFDEAINAMRKGIRIMPTQPEGYNNLASVLLNSSQDDSEAESLLRRAIQLRPHYGKAHFNLGKFYLKHNRPLDAYHAFKIACTQADFDTEVGFITWGNVGCTVHRYQDAVEAYTRALAINPRSSDALIRRIYALEQAGDVTRAQQELQRLMQAQPASQYALLTRLAELWFEQEYYQKALSLYEQVATHKPTVGVLYRLALTAEKTGNYQRARQLVERLQTARVSPDIQAGIAALQERLSS